MTYTSHRCTQVLRFTTATSGGSGLWRIRHNAVCCISKADCNTLGEHARLVDSCFMHSVHSTVAEVVHHVPPALLKGIVLLSGVLSPTCTRCSHLQAR